MRTEAAVDLGEMRHPISAPATTVRSSLQVHHLTKQSQLGHDELDNLIALCVDRHRQRHRATDSNWLKV